MTHPKRQVVIDRAIAQNHKITDADVAASTTLREVATDYVQTYKGLNSFIQSIAVNLSDRGYLTVAQMRGALNVMVAEARNSRQDHQTVNAARNDKPLTLDFSSLPEMSDRRAAELEAQYRAAKLAPQAPSEAPRSTEPHTPVVSPDVASASAPSPSHERPSYDQAVAEINELFND